MINTEVRINKEVDELADSFECEETGRFLRGKFKIEARKIADNLEGEEKEYCLSYIEQVCFVQALIGKSFR